jgi:hypothetical protein
VVETEPVIGTLSQKGSVFSLKKDPYMPMFRERTAGLRQSATIQGPTTIPIV